jgi:hypothetical protein
LVAMVAKFMSLFARTYTSTNHLEVIIIFKWTYLLVIESFDNDYKLSYILFYYVDIK